MLILKRLNQLLYLLNRYLQSRAACISLAPIDLNSSKVLKKNKKKTYKTTIFQFQYIFEVYFTNNTRTVIFGEMAANPLLGP